MLRLIFLLVTLFSVYNAYSEEIKKDYIFGVFPHMPKDKLYSVYNPISQNFSEILDVEVHLRTKDSLKRFRQALANSQYDIAFIQPFDYPDAYDLYGYIPIARRNKHLQTIIVVDKNSPYRDIKSLIGKNIATSDKESAVSILTDKGLIKLGYRPDQDFQRTYKNNHFSCLQSVLVGHSQACGTAERALVHFEEINLKNRFRIIKKMEPIPHALFIVHERVPKKMRDKLSTTITNWNNTLQGKKILSNGNMIQMIKATNSDYKKIRSIIKDN